MRPLLLILDSAHHPSKKTWIYSLILPFLWLATIYLLPVSMHSPISGQVWVLGSCFLKPWDAIEHSINPEASTCRRVRQSPREETASQVTLTFITLRGKGVLVTIMQGYKACWGCMVTLSEWREVWIWNQSGCPLPARPQISPPVRMFLGLPGAQLCVSTKNTGVIGESMSQFYICDLIYLKQYLNRAENIHMWVAQDRWLFTPVEVGFRWHEA